MKKGLVVSDQLERFLSNTMVDQYLECLLSMCLQDTAGRFKPQCFYPSGKIVINYVGLYISCPCPFLVWLVNHEPERAKQSYICKMFLCLAHICPKTTICSDYMLVYRFSVRLVSNACVPRHIMSNSISMRSVHKALQNRVIPHSH